MAKGNMHGSHRARGREVSRTKIGPYNPASPPGSKPKESKGGRYDPANPPGSKPKNS